MINDQPDPFSGFYIFTVTGGAVAFLPAAGLPLETTAVIQDKAGREIYRMDAPPGLTINNFRAQEYRGKPVLTWWEGTAAGAQTTAALDAGVCKVADEHYQVIATLRPSTGVGADAHECRLTPDGRALITSIASVPYDLSAIGGPRDGWAQDWYANVLDVETGETLFSWDSMAHVPITDGYHDRWDPVSAFIMGGESWMTWHINSIALDSNGNLLISMRQMSTVYDVDIHTGEILWQVGGKHSSFAMGPGTEFAFQHDPEMTGNVLHLFNNNSDGSMYLGDTSMMWLDLDMESMTANLAGKIGSPGNAVTVAMGNIQTLPGGYSFGSWGTVPRLTEYGPRGEQIYEAAPQTGPYRSTLQPWNGTPSTAPALLYRQENHESPARGIRATTGAIHPAAHAIWNGATQVHRWRVLHGATASTLTPLTTVDWNGRDTEIPLTDPTGLYELQALDTAGDIIGQTDPAPLTLSTAD
ncbi:arylsulfotransferase family protein [Nocardia sp. NPDC046763]|uniref:arylsulfotransferase family protein n=1 Tax=Nocardia sp. NPDC046763 TaxID=3155256 RepID=UPI0033E8E603